MSAIGDTEFGFELLTCRWAERNWPPIEASVDDDGARETDSRVVVARQLGTRKRRWDTVVVETTREALAARAAFGTEELDSDLLHVVRNAPAEWAWYRDALPHPGYPWRYVRAAIHRAAARGVVEKRRAGNRIEIRRIAPYPDWVDRIVAVENKPDLDASAARALADQLEHDVEAALADEVWVATAATGEPVEPALLEDLPVEVGILAMAFDQEAASEPWRVGAAGEAEVLWYPGTLDGAGGSTDGSRADGEHADGGDGDDADANAATDADQDAGTGVDAAERAERRLVIAERAYGRGWRSYADTMRPDCRHFELRRAGAALVPWCAAKGRHQTAAECAGSCTAFEPEPPQWRTRGWPIEGGPGKRIKRLLADRRTRRR